jgi:amino acid adenylation domain-containing protein
MTTAEFVAHLCALDIRVTIDGDRLRCSAPQGVLTDALRSELMARKADVIAWLREHQEAPRQIFPLTFAQQRLWFLDQLGPGSAAYTISARRYFRGPLDRASLTRALTELVRRHESLRTIFPSRDGTPVQRIDPPQAVPLDVIDLQSVPAGERATVAWRTIHGQVARPFDLERGPLFRAALIEYGPEDHDLLMVVHHIVADGWSLGILARELSALYDAFQTGRPSPLPEPDIQYADFALWQHRWLTGEVLDAQRQYWLEQLADRPEPLSLPIDYRRSAWPSEAGAIHEFALPPGLADDLRALSRREHATLFMLLLAAFKVLLARYSGQEDILVGTPVANRSHVELEAVVGFFANTLVLRTDLTGDPPFSALLARVRETCLAAYAHPDMPFEKLVEELQPLRVLGQNPLFQVGFVLQDATVGGDLAFITIAAPFDLMVFIRDGPDGRLGGTIQYKRDLFAPETIARLVGHYRVLLEGVVADPGRRLWDLPLMDEAESQQILVDWNATTVPYSRDRSLPSLFEDMVDARPDAVALVDGDETLTYDELDQRANRLAHHLRALGVAAERPVGVVMDRSSDLIVGILGILKAGGAYVPLDPQAPPDRLAFVLRNTRIDIVLAQPRMRDRLAALDARTIWLDGSRGPLGDQPAARLGTATAAEALAYVMYTSGSTGEPKGVAVTHRNVIRLVKGADYARFGPDEIVLQLAAPSFDASTFEIWGALLNGGRLVIAPPGPLSMDDLGLLLARHRVTTLWLTAGLFEQVVDHRPDSLRPLRQLLAGGDVLSPAHVRRLLSTLPELRVVNGYGPTEGTTFTCCHPIRELPAPGRSVPIGRPIANTRVYLLDRQRRPVPIGVPGELWIAGDGLARGYLQRPELTAERFVVQRLSPTLEERLYRTGDLVRWLPDGTLDFLGRLDDQLKIHGFRVEPGEIEATLARHPRVRAAVVLAPRVPGHDPRLIAYVVTDGPVDTQELRDFLMRTLPEYMIPGAVVMLDHLPLTANGKINRQALPEPMRAASIHEMVEPRDELEHELREIWRDVLAVNPVGVRDSFFDLGGHSLLAVRMFAKLTGRLGVALPLATLFEAPTIEGLATIIRRGLRPAAGRSLVAIQPAGKRPPLFGMPGVGGNTINYHALARYLGPDQPFYGLQSRGLDGVHPPLTTIEEIAAGYLREIREVHPEGPYHFIGMCMGGVVAYEMAQQLRAAGQRVAMLVLLETWAPDPAFTPIDWPVPATLRVLSERLHASARTLGDLRGRERRRYLLGRLRLLVDIVVKRDPLLGARAEIYQRAVTRANLRAFQRYTPRPYPAPVVLFCAEERKVAETADRRLTWRELTGGQLEIFPAAGADSGLLLMEPYVRALAAQIQTCIDRSRRPDPAHT